MSGRYNLRNRSPKENASPYGEINTDDDEEENYDDENDSQNEDIDDDEDLLGKLKRKPKPKAGPR
jgi:hypothetical protein